MSGNFGELLLGAGSETDVALIEHAGKVRSHGELATAARRIAAVLRGAGVEDGDRVFLLADNSFFAVASYLGTLLSGGVCVPLPPTTSPDDLAALRARTVAKLAFVQRKR